MSSQPYNGPGNTSPTVFLNNLSTLSVVRSGSINCSNIRCLNVIGAFSLSIQAASLNVNGQLLIVSTGAGPVSLRLDNGGTVASDAVHRLGAGAVLNVIFDGTNLASQN